MIAKSREVLPSLERLTFSPSFGRPSIKLRCSDVLSLNIAPHGVLAIMNGTLLIDSLINELIESLTNESIINSFNDSSLVFVCRYSGRRRRSPAAVL